MLPISSWCPSRIRLQFPNNKNTGKEVRSNVEFIIKKHLLVAWLGHKAI